MEYGMQGGQPMPFKKVGKAKDKGEVSSGMAGGGKKSGKARMQGLSLAGRKGASRRGRKG